MADETIEFVLTAKDATRQAFESLTANLSGVESAVARVAGGIAAAIAAVVSLEIKFAGMAETLQDNALILDVNAQTLREWQHTAEVAGVKGEDLVSSLERLSRSAGDAARQGTGPLHDAFLRLGISQVDLLTKFKSMDTLFPAVVAGLRNMGATFQQVQTTVELLGRSSVPLVEIWRTSPELIEKQTEAFRTNAGVLNDEELNALAAVKESMNSWFDTIEQRGLKLFADLTLAVGKWADEYTKRRMQERLADLKKELADVHVITVAGNEWEQLWNKIAGYISIAGGGDPAAAAANRLENIKRQIQETEAELAALDVPSAADAPAAGGGHSDITSLIFGSGYSIEQLEQDVRDYVVQAGIIARINEEIAIQTDAQRGIQADADRLANDDYIAGLENRYDLARTLLTQQQDFEKKVNEQKVQSAIANSFALLASATQGHRSLFAVSKAAAIASAIVSTYQAATQALADVPYPYNYVVAAATIAAGLANVATISSTQFGSTAAATSQAGPGGFGAQPGQVPAPFIATPAAAQQQGSVTIVVDAKSDAARALLSVISIEVQQNDAVLFRKDSRQAAELR